MSRSFDGADDYITAVTADLSSGFSVFGWQKVADKTSDHALFGDNSVDANHLCQIWFDENTTNDRWQAATFDGVGFDVVTGTTNPTQGQYYFVGATYNGTTLKLYINGVQEGADVTAGMSSATHEYIWGGIGSTGTTIIKDHNGLIAHGHVYNRALSTNEISQIMRYPGSIRNGLLTYQPLWGGSPEPDYSGNGNHGTVTGATVSADNPPINGVFHPPRPNLYYSSFSTATGTSATAKIQRMMLMGVS